MATHTVFYGITLVTSNNSKINEIKFLSRMLCAVISVKITVILFLSTKEKSDKGSKNVRIKCNGRYILFVDLAKA